MLKIEYSSRFKRDYKKIAKDQDTVAKIREVLTLLVNEKQLPAKNRPHPLAGNYQNYMECHIKPDLLLVYRINDNLLILELFRTIQVFRLNATAVIHCSSSKQHQ